MRLFRVCLLAASVCRPACVASAVYLLLFLWSGALFLALSPRLVEAAALLLSVCATTFALTGALSPTARALQPAAGLASFLPDLLLALASVLCLALAGYRRLARQLPSPFGGGDTPLASRHRPPDTGGTAFTLAWPAFFAALTCMAAGASMRPGVLGAPLYSTTVIALLWGGLCGGSRGAASGSFFCRQRTECSRSAACGLAVLQARREGGGRAMNDLRLTMTHSPAAAPRCRRRTSAPSCSPCTWRSSGTSGERTARSALQPPPGPKSSPRTVSEPSRNLPRRSAAAALARPRADSAARPPAVKRVSFTGAQL